MLIYGSGKRKIGARRAAYPYHDFTYNQTRNVYPLPILYFLFIAFAHAPFSTEGEAAVRDDKSKLEQIKKNMRYVDSKLILDYTYSAPVNLRRFWNLHRTPNQPLVGQDISNM